MQSSGLKDDEFLSLCTVRGDVCAQAMCFSKICPFMYLNFSWCNNGILSKDHTGNTVPTRAKIIPYLRVETPENHTLSGGPYLSSVNMRVNPSPQGYIVHNNWLRAHQSRTEGSAYWSQPHPPWNVEYGSDVGNKQSRQKMWHSKHFSMVRNTVWS